MDIALEPELAHTCSVATTVITEGTQRGRTIADPTKLNQKNTKTKVALDVNFSRATDLLKKHLTDVLKRRVK
ncbi:hypothetical protein [Eubacterium aggregans]|uniref:hypothetical protein n=1 Tax=Eubacterium aggregans TaxID=81409 RepID=UPI003F29FFDE